MGGGGYCHGTILADLNLRASDELAAEKNFSDIHHPRHVRRMMTRMSFSLEVKMPSLFALLEAGRLLGIDRKVVNQAVLDNVLPGKRLGVQWFVDEEDVLAWAKTRRIINREPRPRALRCDHVLAYIAEHPGCHAGEIGEALGQSRRVDQVRMQELEPDGLIVRHAQATTSKPWTSEITPAGRDWLNHQMAVA